VGGGVGDGLEIVDQVHGLEAEVIADAAGRQWPRQVGRDHAAVGQRVAGAGDDAFARARGVGVEVGQDLAQPGVVGAAVAAVGDHVDGLARRGTDQPHPHMGAADIGGDQRHGRRGDGLVLGWTEAGDHAVPPECLQFHGELRHPEFRRCLTTMSSCSAKNFQINNVARISNNPMIAMAKIISFETMIQIWRVRRTSRLHS